MKANTSGTIPRLKPRMTYPLAANARSTLLLMFDFGLEIALPMA